LRACQASNLGGRGGRGVMWALVGGHGGMIAAVHGDAATRLAKKRSQEGPHSARSVNDALTSSNAPLGPDA
jgi:hypothetical protein